MSYQNKFMSLNLINSIVATKSYIKKLFVCPQFSKPCSKVRFIVLPSKTGRKHLFDYEFGVVILFLMKLSKLNLITSSYHCALCSLVRCSTYGIQFIIQINILLENCMMTFKVLITYFGSNNFLTAIVNPNNPSNFKTMK